MRFFLHIVIKIIMNKVQKQLDQKVKTINKIQNNLKRNKIQQSNILRNDNLEFPPINNIVMTFPIKSSPRTKAVHSIHTPSKKIKQQLEQIFLKNNVQLNGNNVSKIIFGGPVKNRMALDHTFRVSFGIDKFNQKLHYRSLSKSKLHSKKSQESISRNIDPMLTSFQRQSSIENLNQLHALTPSVDVKKTHESKMYNPFTTLQNSYKMRQAFFNNRRKRQNPEVFPKSLGRYSPWGNRQHDDQQIL